MSTALIYINLDAVHPIINSVWHRTNINRLPSSGEPITMLCGATAPAEFEGAAHRDVIRVARQCWDCERVYREKRGLPAPPNGYPEPAHPVPHPR
ncbi:hypothetical protein [Amycolatopsis samaneae]|uniref:Uncharacterized protein n=1 Tax=Amycolatopsis samaneae TaxID=664691 RepID=A0ABW5GAY9_9PSEU